MENHSVKADVWIYIIKKGVGEAGLSLEEAVDEAVCFGWIDGKMKSVDEKRFILRFSKRRPSSVWSKINRDRAEKMIESGRMAEAGLESVEEAKKTGNWYNAYTSKVSPTVPKDLAEALRTNPIAMDGFTHLSNSARLQLIVWIENAKKPETRRKRIDKCIRRIVER